MIERSVPDIQALLSEIGREKVLAIFQLGSLAHGGYDPLVSDIDVALLLKNPETGGSIALSEKVKQEIMAKGVRHADRYSLFIGTVDELNNAIGKTRFTIFDVLDLLHHGRCIFGDESSRKLIVEPDFKSLVVNTFNFTKSYVFASLFKRGFEDLIGLYSQDYILFSKFLLLPPRCIYTLEKRSPASTNEAVAYYCSQYHDPSSQIVEKALAWRRKRPSYQEVSAIPKTSIRLIYENFFQRYEKTLESFAENTLVAEIKKLRSDLNLCAPI